MPWNLGWRPRAGEAAAFGTEWLGRLSGWAVGRQELSAGLDADRVSNPSDLCRFDSET